MKKILFILALGITSGIHAQINQSYQGKNHTTPSQTPLNQFYSGFVSNDGSNYPANYGSLLGYTNSSNGYGYSYQIFKGHTIPRLKIRFADYSSGGNTWYSWKSILDSGNDIIYEGNNEESAITGYSKIIGRSSDGILHLMAGTHDGSIYLNYNKNGNIYLANQGGNVGIGTLNTGNWKLSVNGNIRAKEIKVETGWSDFVFYDSYKLPTLKEVEEHIKEKGHLQGIPSAKEVEENGIFLGEMDAKLLQKIEELTLYTIQQEKEIARQSKEIEALKSLNKKLLDIQARLKKLELEKP